MKRLKLFAFAAMALSCTACASLPADLPGTGRVSWPAEQPGMTQGEDTSANAADIGATLVKAPLMLRLEGKCRQPGIHVSLNTHAVGPRLVLAGQDISQSFTYTLCGRNADTIDGKLISRIYHGGQPVSVRERDYRLTEGRWSVRFEATVPEGAPTGDYGMELQFMAGDINHFTDLKSFRLVK